MNTSIIPFRDVDRHCKRCEYELDGGEDICPRCQFSPREKGLRVALVLLMTVAVSMTITLLAPTIGPVLVYLAVVSFLLSLVVFFVSFLATPHRFGSLFLRL